MSGSVAVTKVINVSLEKPCGGAVDRLPQLPHCGGGYTFSLALVRLVVGLGLCKVRRWVLEEFLLRRLVAEAVGLTLVDTVYGAIGVHDLMRGKSHRAHIFELAGRGVSRRAKAE